MASRRSRRNPGKPSLLTTIQSASAAFTGEARATAERPVSAEETSFRGSGYRITAEIRPQEALFGPLPSEPLPLEGDTKYPPEQRLHLGAVRFPPDSLRQESYWEYAQVGAVQPVLVILADPPDVHLLTGPDDDLPETVKLVYGWTQLPKKEQRDAILSELRQGQHSPLAYVAGFELLAPSSKELPKLVDDFLKLSDRPGAATQGILQQLYVLATSLPDKEITALARQLRSKMADESEPAALLGYLTWFDAHRRAWEGNTRLRNMVTAEAQRVQGLTLTGPDGPGWQKRVQDQAGRLLVDSHPDEEGGQDAD